MPVATPSFARLRALPVTFVIVVLSVICGTACGALGQESAEQRVARQQASAWSAFYDELYNESAKQCAAVQKSGNTGNKRARFEAAHCQARCFWALATRPGWTKAKQVWSQLAKRASTPVGQIRVAIARAVMLDGDRRRGRLPQAIEALETVCRGRPAGTATAEAAIELARLYVVAGRYDDAEVMLKSVAKRLRNLRQLEITEVDAKPFLAAAKKALKRLKYERDAGREPFEKARALQRAEKFRKAIKAFEEITQSFSQSDYAPRSQLHVGECLVGLKKPKQAVMHWGRFIIAAPTGPWRGQAHVALIDLLLEHSLDLAGAKAQAIRAYDSVPAGLEDEHGAESWQAVASDIYLRIGIIAYLEGRYPGAAHAFEETCQQASNPKAVRQQLEPLIAAATAGRPVTPAEVRGSGANEKVALALALGRIHITARRWERAERLFNRVQKSSPIGRPSQAQRSYAKFGLALALQGQRKPAKAKTAFLDSLQEHPKGSWHDETLFRLASMIQQQAERKFEKKADTDEDCVGCEKKRRHKRLTREEREKVAAEEASRLAGFRRARAEALPYWQKLAGSYPDSPYAELGMYFSGILHQESEEWADAATAWLRFLKVYPRSPWAGDAIVRLLDICLERTLDFGVAQTYVTEGIRWSQVVAQGGLASEYTDTVFRPGDGIASPGPGAIKRALYDIYLRAGLMAYLNKEFEQSGKWFSKANGLGVPRPYQVVHGTLPTGAERLIQLAGRQQAEQLTPNEVYEGEKKFAMVLALGDLYFHAEEWLKARELYLRVYNHRPRSNTSSAQKAWAAFMMARTHLWKFEFEEANYYYHVVFEKYPQVPWADRALLYNATMAYSNLRNMDEAIWCLERVKKQFPGGEMAERATYLIGQLYEWKKQWQKALVAYQEYLKKYPKGMYAKNMRATHLPKVKANLGK